MKTEVLLNEKCNYPNCTRQAVIQSHDEIEIEPEQDRHGNWYECGEVVKYWYWCQYHRKASKEVDKDGNTLKIFTSQDPYFVRKQWHERIR